MQIKLFMILIATFMLSFALTAAKGDVFAYLLGWQIMLIGTSFCLAFLLAGTIWRKLPQNLKKTIERKKRFCDALIIVYTFVFIVTKKLIDHKLSAGSSGHLWLLGSVNTFIFLVFIIWSLIRKRWITVLIAVIFIPLFLLGLFESATPEENSANNHDSVSALRELASLPYLGYVSAENSFQKISVTKHNRDLAFSGFNLYADRFKPQAYLMDMDGNVVHTWSTTSLPKAWWFAVELCSNGDLLVALNDLMLVRLDWDSNIRWTKKIRVHHDITIDKKGMIYVLSRQDSLVRCKGIPLPILNDLVVVISPDGRVIKKVYLYDIVKERFGFSTIVDEYLADWSQPPLKERVFLADRTKGLVQPTGIAMIIGLKAKMGWCFAQDSPFDILHSNSIQILDRSIEGFCKKNDWLISIRQLNLIAVINPQEERLVWTWGPDSLDKQHCPSLLDNGNLLIYDNRPNSRFSRVIEMEPLSGKIQWQYKAEHPQDFFSYIEGFSQRMPNGNTLITESMKGRVFEVTSDGNLVWEFYEPNLNKNNLTRQPIYQMKRILDPQITQQIYKRINPDNATSAHNN